MDEIFLNELRKALNHLYDPIFLGRSQLGNQFALVGSFDRGPKLQRILENAISDLKPTQDQPRGAKTLVAYKFLSLRYLQQLDQKQVADQLNISRTQLFRVQQNALSTLGLALWEKFDLGDHSPGLANDISSLNDQGTEEHLAPFLTGVDESSADLAQVLLDLEPIFQTLLGRLDTKTVHFIDPNLPLVALSPAALRQLLLTLVNVSMEGWPQKALRLEARLVEGSISVQILSGTARLLNDDILTPLEQISKLTGVKVIASEYGPGLTLAIFTGIPVLIVEDNPDQAIIFERMLAGTRYQAIVCTNSAETLARVEQSGAKAVLLDVMMPNLDGWSVLHNLRAHPATYKVPIIISSILPVERLSRALSADAFLAKPVRAEYFLALLDRLINPPEKAPDSPSPSGGSDLDR
jgi:CheY-like chemotaxis protein